jgi:alkanesulfonate monooxygenase SsuD/methylene tetrahydromethanopterin reductase-like flavin-dependent oxidoreductase (luciferase family)
LDKPVQDIGTVLNDAELHAVKQMLQYSFIGSAAAVKKQMQEFVDTTGVNELMIVSIIYDHAARIKSYKLVAGARGK